VHLAGPLIIFPVSNVSTLSSLTPFGVRSSENDSVTDAKGKPLAGADHDSSDSNILGDVVVMKKNSTVEDLYLTLKRNPYRLIDGLYIRAEYRPFPTSSKDLNFTPRPMVLRKTEVLTSEKCVVRIITNRKVSWQGGGENHQRK